MESQVTVNPDLKRERTNVQFNPIQMTYLLYGGKDKVKRKQYIENLVLADPGFDGPEYYFQSLSDRYEDGVKKEVHLARRIRELNLTDPQDISIFTGTALDGEGSAFALHRIAFLPPIRMQGTEEQQQKWLPLIESFQVFGSYAQTELGHGSNVRALETTAVYNPSTQEFVVNTPSLTATKWWPGNLGKTCNHTLLIAQTYTQGKNVGIQAFIVQLRDIETHMPLKGVTVGNIGPPVGISMSDNGFLRLDHVRIPRENMLAKFSRIEADGTFIKPANERALYTGMMGIRASIPSSNAHLVAASSTIATRYSLVRRQSELRPGSREPQVLDYQTQQHKLFPAISMAYCFWVASDWIQTRYQMFMEDLKRNDFKNMLPLHAASSCLKAHTSEEVTAMVEVCRLACGGHGYSKASGFPRFHSWGQGNITAEGEATILHLQTSRYLMKAALNAQQGKQLESTLSYLTDVISDKFVYHGDIDMQGLVQAFKYRARRCVQKAAERIQSLMAQGKQMYDAFNHSGVYLVQASQAHADILVVDAFLQKLTSLRQSGDEMVKYLEPLGAVYAIVRIIRASGDFIEDGWMSASQIDFLKEKLYQIYDQMRPNAIAYVDAFDFRDRQLQSVLGRYDGDVYTKLYEWAQKAPLNQTEVHESFNKYIRPMREEVNKSKL